MVRPDTLIFRSHIVKLLSYVEEHPHCTVTEIKENAESSTQTINNLISDLIREEILTEIRGQRYNTKYLELTTKGKQILEHIRIINAIYQDENPKQKNDHGPSDEIRSTVTAND